MSWERHYDNTWKHDSDEQTLNNIKPFLRAAMDGNKIPLYAMTDYLEERGHPAAKIIRSALDEGEHHYFDPSRRAHLTHDWMLTNPNKHTGRIRKNFVSVGGPEVGYHHFYTNTSPSHDDYLHSTGMPQ